MTKKDIVRLAREAHREVVTKDYKGHAGQLDPWTMRLLERFAALVAAAEREACIEVLLSNFDIEDKDVFNVAAAIRARGNK
jgi:hypothetical protein